VDNLAVWSGFAHYGGVFRFSEVALSVKSPGLPIMRKESLSRSSLRIGGADLSGKAGCQRALPPFPP